MGIINRTMDESEQKEELKAVAVNVANATDIPIAVIQRPCTVQSTAVSMLGLSGAPNILLKALRFVAGTGGSSFVLGSTFAVTGFGTSGYVGYSLVALGSSQLSLQKGDLLVAQQGGGSGAASTATLVEVVVKNTQDVKTWV